MILNWLLKRPPAKEHSPAPKNPSAPPASGPMDPKLEIQKKKLLKGCVDYLLDLKEFPGEKAIGVSCSYPGTENRMSLSIEPDAANPALHRLCTRGVRQGTDLCVMHYICKGTSEEIRAYLSDGSHAEELLKSWQQLSDSVDKKN